MTVFIGPEVSDTAKVQLERKDASFAKRTTPLVLAFISTPINSVSTLESQFSGILLSLFESG